LTLDGSFAQCCGQLNVLQDAGVVVGGGVVVFNTQQVSLVHPCLHTVASFFFFNNTGQVKVAQVIGFGVVVMSKQQ
jgi:hypothetical protein